MERYDMDTVWMRYPAAWWHDIWRDGLAGGNGRVGADVYGGVKDMTVMLTHHALWHCGHANELPDVGAAFAEQRRMMDEENFREASWRVVNELKERGYESELQSPFPAGDLLLRFRPKAAFSDYSRGVHMESGEMFTVWREGDSERAVRAFVSRAHQAVVLRIASSQADIDCALSLDAHRNPGSDQLEKWGKHLLDSMERTAHAPYLTYSALNDDGSCFGICAKVYVREGEVEPWRENLQVTGAREVLVLCKVFAGESAKDRAALCARYCRELDALEPDFGLLLGAHQRVHEPLYRSAGLSFGVTGPGRSNEELLLEAYRGKQPAELIEKLWRFGRYLFISGTDEGADPFPMYGLWAGDYRLQWPHNMANENIQMIYWHTFAGNLLPFQKAFYRYFNERIPAFRENARRLFHMRGIYMTAGTTPGVSAPTQVVPVIMNWVSAAGWIAQHYCQYARYTGDREYFRREILPYLLEVAAFYEDFVTFYPDGTVHFYPSVSPENTPGNFMPPKHIKMPHPMPTTVNSTIDLVILKEFFTAMCGLAEENPDLKLNIAPWKKILSSIPAYRTNAQGAIREWQDSRFEERYDHRHLSHIYPVFPGREINPLHGAELMPAFERAVRLREIDAQTGWSMAHMASIFARLGRGEDAMESLDKMARSCLTNSFFSLHNDWRGMNISWNMDPSPVQLDALMGYVNAVQEMLLYSSEDLLSLLPALPEKLSRGNARSLRYESGWVEMRWDREKGFFQAEIRALRPHRVTLRLPAFAKRSQITVQNGAVQRTGDEWALLNLEQNGTVTIFQNAPEE